MLSPFPNLAILTVFFKSYIFLAVIGAFFCILIILAIRKSYILKKESEKLFKFNEVLKETSFEKDYSQDHIYKKQ